jgi:hypothetical protein
MKSYPSKGVYEEGFRDCQITIITDFFTFVNITITYHTFQILERPLPFAAAALLIDNHRSNHHESTLYAVRLSVDRPLDVVG